MAGTGKWPLPLAVAVAAAGRRSLSDLADGGTHLYWLERRPEEGGRTVLVRTRAGEVPEDVTPAGTSVGSRVHEYGGGAYCLVPLGAGAPCGLSSTAGVGMGPHASEEPGVGAPGGLSNTVAYVDRGDQRVRLLAGGGCRPLTPEPPAGERWCHGDLRATPDGRWVLAVRERHAGGRVVREVVALPTGPAAGATAGLVTGPATGLAAGPAAGGAGGPGGGPTGGTGSGPGATGPDGDPAPAPVILCSGRDFFAAPRPDPTGRRLAWICWDHPDMPWDASELWVADLHLPAADASGGVGPAPDRSERAGPATAGPIGAGLAPDGPVGTGPAAREGAGGGAGPLLAGARRVAGGRGRGAVGDGESVGQPLWCGDGSLVFVSDAGGWWQPWRWVEGALPRRLCAEEAEFHGPDWALGQATLAELPGGALACRRRRDGRDQVGLLVPPPAAAGGSARPAGPTDPAGAAPASRPAAGAGDPADSAGALPAGEDGSWRFEPIDQPCVTVPALCAHRGGPAWLGATATAGPAPWWAPLADAPALGPARPYGPLPAALLDPAHVSVAEHRTAPGPGGRPVHLLYYPPTADGRAGPPGSPPPLVVACHGGPTGAAEAGFDPVVQLFTTRGYAVAAVDYSGSTGYGRPYRRRLQGGWGVADVDDCVAVARWLAGEGLADPARMVARGSSAGGFTALCALARSDAFAAATSWYGVTDLLALAAATHDFEAHYGDGLVGPLPAAAEEHRRRSPVALADRMSGAVLVL